jgi:hypothetical protein
MHPKAGKQAHGQIDHFLGPGDHDRASLKTPKPMALPAVVPLNPMGLGFTHPQLPRGHDSRIRLPVIGTVERYVPRGEAIDQLLQGCVITTPTFPVQELACSTIQSVPDPEFATFFWRKCHISSSFMTTALPLGLGLT